ncbi:MULTISPECIES: MOSC domain-containing protein [Dethiosulfovibrio]|jgi:MOSC domain-containing protein YiiM|uniref:MOSC domain-containing protein n=2 Tax=Dethiosulfovibrio TaxID=47054 RepID=A0ABS9EJH4_9BACT|nr:MULTISPECIES: MOSC domain-containing protein [Dethiosulfovibrio]MCF4112889.1 MOSC domain-containing protein [Dethiosulfovibrio russensis]MCF4141353.1 MOSC domain-containing protein [Dethiosulfovibrio marinus]MCF4145683.1 MOSC domain-containing protein [Dethiosulfovibrio acidaminovorans]
MSKIEGICISSKRREPKRSVPYASFLYGGIDGDSHRGVSEREVSMLRSEDISAAEINAGFSFPPGSLAENLIVSGLPKDLPVGTELKIGAVSLLLIEIGKKPGEPHSYDYRGWCLLPYVGFFLKVVDEGIVRLGDEVSLEFSELS